MTGGPQRRARKERELRRLLCLPERKPAGVQAGIDSIRRELDALLPEATGLMLTVTAVPRPGYGEPRDPEHLAFLEVWNSLSRDDRLSALAVMRALGLAPHEVGAGILERSRRAAEATAAATSWLANRGEVNAAWSVEYEPTTAKWYASTPYGAFEYDSVGGAELCIRETFENPPSMPKR